MKATIPIAEQFVTLTRMAETGRYYDCRVGPIGRVTEDVALLFTDLGRADRIAFDLLERGEKNWIPEWRSGAEVLALLHRWDRMKRRGCLDFSFRADHNPKIVSAVTLIEAIKSGKREIEVEA